MTFVLALVTAAAVFGVSFPLLSGSHTHRRRIREVLAQYGDPAPGDTGTQVRAQPERLDRLAGLIIRPRYQAWLRRGLDQAGSHGAHALTALLRRKLLYAVIGILVGALLALGGSPYGVLFIVSGAAIGFFLPDILTYNSAIKRDELLARRLSDALDLLNLCVESGMGLQPAMAQVASTQDGPVAAEFARVLREMQLGMSRTQAFEALGERTRQPDLKRFVASIARTESMGIPVASLMKEQSAQMRARRLESAREKAQKVPVKILLPVIVCLLPALFIIVIGPAAISMIRAFAQM